MIQEKIHLKDPKRILICSLGSIGRRHARIFHELLPDIELSVYRSGYGKACPELALMSHEFSDLTDAIAWQPDAAVIASPAPFHQEQALLLARSGIPLLIEKPIGAGTEKQEYWDELSHYSKNLPIVVGYVFRHDHCASYVKSILDSQELGKVLEADFYCGSWLPDWRPDSDYKKCVSSRSVLGGGALLELSHEIDLACWILGVFEINFASLQKSDLLDIDVEDQVLLITSGTKCSSIIIRTNFCSFPSRRRISIRCEKGEIEWNLLDGEVMVQSRQQLLHKFQGAQKPDDRYRLQAERFISAVAGSSAQCCSLSDGLQVMKLINDARLKANGY